MSRERELLALAYSLIGHALPSSIQSQIKIELAKPDPSMKRLSDEEISKYFHHPIQTLGTAIAFARAIETALLEKNKQNKATIELKPSSEDLMNISKYPNCSRKLLAEGKAYPRTCAECGLGPCKAVLTEKNSVL